MEGISSVVQSIALTSQRSLVPIEGMIFESNTAHTNSRFHTGVLLFEWKINDNFAVTA